METLLVQSFVPLPCFQTPGCQVKGLNDSGVTVSAVHGIPTLKIVPTKTEKDPSLFIGRYPPFLNGVGLTVPIPEDRRIK